MSELSQLNAMMKPSSRSRAVPRDSGFRHPLAAALKYFESKVTLSRH